MQLPLQITFRNVSASDPIDAYVRQRAAKLGTFYKRITGCRVAVEAPHRRRRSGRHWRVRIDLTVPGHEIVVSRVPEDSVANQDVYAAIDQAFDEAGRRLEDHIRRIRDVMPHESEYRTGRVTKLWGFEGYGFLAGADGTEVYFHRNAVRSGAFDRLHIGSKVRFLEEMGDKGPQASAVVPSD